MPLTPKFEIHHMLVATTAHLREETAKQLPCGAEQRGAVQALIDQLHRAASELEAALEKLP